MAVIGETPIYTENDTECMISVERYTNDEIMLVENERNLINDYFETTQVVIVNASQISELIALLEKAQAELQSVSD